VLLIRGGPTAATQYLRGEMGVSLIEAMVPEVSDALRVARDPVIGQLLSALTGVDVSTVSRDFAREVNDAIWREIGAEEAAIRANPQSANDPLISAALAAALAY
jgi:hypothetical protein